MIIAMGITLFFMVEDYVSPEQKAIQRKAASIQCVKDLKQAAKDRILRKAAKDKAWELSRKPLGGHKIKMMSDEQREESKRIYDKFMNTKYKQTKVYPTAAEVIARNAKILKEI